MSPKWDRPVIDDVRLRGVLVVDHSSFDEPVRDRAGGQRILIHDVHNQKGWYICGDDIQKNINCGKMPGGVSNGIMTVPSDPYSESEKRNILLQGRGCRRRPIRL